VLFVFFLVARFPVAFDLLDLRPRLGQPASMFWYASLETVDRVFGLLVPLRLRRLIFSTREFFFFVAIN
jgi:hypothetical protein